jgi:hypothetical protein
VGTDKIVGYIVTLGGVIVALVAAVVPVLVAIVRSRDDDDDLPPVNMGMPVQADHMHDAWRMLEEKGSLALEQAKRLLVENEILRGQLTDTHTGWRNTQSDLDEANRRLIQAGHSPVIGERRPTSQPQAPPASPTPPPG